MKVNPINNTTFGSKIYYNGTIEKGFEMAKSNASSFRKKDLDFAKKFSDDVRTILNDGSKSTLLFAPKEDASVNIEKMGGKRITLDKSNSLIEGYQCTTAINKFASRITKSSEKQTKTPIDIIKSQLEDAISLVENLKEQYSMALKEELSSLENQIKKSNL